MIVTTRPLATSSASRSTRRAAFTLLEVLVVVAILVILAGAASISVFSYLQGAKVDAARNTITMLESQCKGYSAKNGGTPPNSLQDLVAPVDGTPPMVEGGLNALLDPWGNQYQYDPSNVDAYGQPDPIVSTLNPQNGQQIFSSKRR
jgi:general secretion pathway protein G